MVRAREKMFTPQNMSHVTCHVSRVTCHVSHVTCHILLFLFFFRTKWWSLSGEGLLSTGPKPSSLNHTLWKPVKTRPRMIKKSVCVRHRLPVTDKDCLWQIWTFCDRHRLCVTDTDCLWQTQPVCDRHKLTVTDIVCLWQTQTVCKRNRLCITDTDSLWQTQTVSVTDCLSQTVCHRHRPPVSDTDCMSSKQTVRDSLQFGRPSLPEADPPFDLLLPYHQLTHIQPQPVSSLGHHPAPDPTWKFIKLGIY